MTDIPEQVTLPTSRLERSALRSLMANAPPGFTFDELLQLVLLKGLAALVRGRELPGISEEITQEAQARLPSRTSPSNSQRVSHDYIGFFIEEHDDQALEELRTQHPFVDEDELCRIVFSAGLRAVPDDDAAQRSLTAAVWTEADGSKR